MAVTPGGGSGTPPINILIGPPTGGTARDVTNSIAWDTIRVEESGNQEGATFEASLLDRDRSFAAMRGRWRIRVDWRNPVSGLFEPMFLGIITTPTPEIQAIYGELAIHAVDVGTLMDRCFIGKKDVVRKSGESDKARIQWLFGGLEAADGVKVAQPLISAGLAHWGKVQTLRADMPRQTFPAQLSLRQALERVLSQASDDDTADYFMDAYPRLWTFDRATMASVLDSAPYDINAAHTLGAGPPAEVAPESDPRVEWDSDGQVTGLHVTAATPKLSRTYWDSDPFSALSSGLPGPYGVALFGRLMKAVSAPDADTAAKVQRFVRAALRDTRNPVPRVSFAVTGTSCYDSTGKRWRAGQRVYVTSPVHGLNGRSTDAGPWAGSGGSASAQLQPFRIKRVTTTFESGAGTMRQEVEAGGRRKILYDPGG